MLGAFFALDEMLAGVDGDVGGSEEVTAFYADLATHDAGEPGHGGVPRVFILLVDSLRYDVAIDKKIMPKLQKLKKRGVYGKIDPGHDGVTVPCLRAAFAGRDNFRVFSFVKNFFRGEAQFHSWFDQVQGKGLKSVVFTDDAFAQFGSRIDTYRSNKSRKRNAKSDRKRQHSALRQALKTYDKGTHEVVIFHLTYSDHVAHRSRVGRKSYKKGFKYVDGMIDEVAARMRPEDTLAVFGDHGHNNAGTHAMGMDIPTFATFVGPGFKPNTDLGTASITTYRYFLSWAVGVSLAPDYLSTLHPEALASLGEIHPSFKPSEGRATGVSPPTRSRLYLWALALGVLASLWTAWRRTLDARLLPWLAAGLVALLLQSLQPFSLAASAAIAAVPLLGRVRGASRKELAWLIVPVLLAFAFVAWGEVLAGLRDELHRLGNPRVRKGYYAAIVVTLALALGVGAVRASWSLIAVVGLLTFPTIYAYGTSGGGAWLWGAWVLVWLGARFRQAGKPTSAWGQWLMGIVLAGIVLWFVQYFAMSRSFNFRFAKWGPLFKELSPGSPTHWLALAAFGKALAMVRWGRAAWRVNIVAVAAVALLTAFEMGKLSMTSPWMLALGGGLLAGAGWLPTRVREAERGQLRLVLLLTGLFVLMYYLLRLDVPSHRWMSLALGAVGASAALVRNQDVERQRHASAQVALFGLILAGWASLTWSFGRIEWKFLFDWTSTEGALKWIGLAGPIIALRYLIPVFMVRAAVHFHFEGAKGSIRSLAFPAMAFKMLTLTAIAGGLGFVMPGTSIYLGAVQQVAVACLLALAFL